MILGSLRSYVIKKTNAFLFWNATVQRWDGISNATQYKDYFEIPVTIEKGALSLRAANPRKGFSSCRYDDINKETRARFILFDEAEKGK